MRTFVARSKQREKEGEERRRRREVMSNDLGGSRATGVGGPRRTEEKKSPRSDNSFIAFSPHIICSPFLAGGPGPFPPSFPRSVGRENSMMGSLWLGMRWWAEKEGGTISNRFALLLFKPGAMLQLAGWLCGFVGWMDGLSGHGQQKIQNHGAANQLARAQANQIPLLMWFPSGISMSILLGEPRGLFGNARVFLLRFLPAGNEKPISGDSKALPSLLLSLFSRLIPVQECIT